MIVLICSVEGHDIRVVDNGTDSFLVDDVGFEVLLNDLLLADDFHCKLLQLPLRRLPHTQLNHAKLAKP